MPDVTIDCGPPAPLSYESTAPTVLFEVPSAFTRRIGLLRKVEYARLATLGRFVILEPGRPEAILWSRAANGSWSSETVRGVEGALTLPAVAVSLPMADVYEDVAFDAASA